MSTPMLGEIRMVGYGFAPRGWALCNGQVLSINQNTALFSLLGTTYGGNGQTTFALPDLRGRVAIHQGDGPATSPYTLGQTGGAETVTLLSTQMPAHSHPLAANSNPGADKTPIGNYIAGVHQTETETATAFSPSATGQMSGGAIGAAGGSQPHPNIQPYLCVNFIIALEGIYPSRN